MAKNVMSPAARRQRQAAASMPRPSRRKQSDDFAGLPPVSALADQDDAGLGKAQDESPRSVPDYLELEDRQLLANYDASVPDLEDWASAKAREGVIAGIMDNRLRAIQIRKERGDLVPRKLVGEAIADAVRRSVASYAAQMAPVVQLVPPNLRNDASAIIESARPIAAAAALAEDQAG